MHRIVFYLITNIALYEFWNTSASPIVLYPVHLSTVLVLVQDTPGAKYDAST